MGSKKSVGSHKVAPKSALGRRTRAPAAEVHARRGEGEASTPAATDAELDTIYGSFLQQPAQLTREQTNLIERRLCTGDAQWRQLALASLTKSGVELKERFAATREAAQLAAELLIVAEDMGKRLRQLAGLLETASTRLMLSLCERADMKELIALARTRMQGATAKTSAES